jgi:hypothetical protein
VKIRILSIAFIVLLPLLSWGMKDSVAAVKTDTLVLKIDSTSIGKDTFTSSGSEFLDSLKNEKILRKLFFLNETITGNAIAFEEVGKERSLPGIKMIKHRLPKRDTWKFWVLGLTLVLLAFIRLSNIKRFDELLTSAGELQPNLMAYTEKLGNYLFIQISLFLNFLIGISLFWVNYSQQNHLLETADYYFVLWEQVLVLVIAYLVKSFASFIVGQLSGMKTLSSILLFNTLVVNNFLGVVLVFLNLLYLYIPGEDARSAIEAIILISIFVAVIYRQIKNILMSLNQSKEQLIYIILYFCSLEIVPWLILLKIFINGW